MYRDVNKQVQAWKKDTCPEVCIFRKRGVITSLATWLCLRVHLIPVRDSQWTTESTSLIWKSNVVKHLEMASLPKRKTRETRLGDIYWKFSTSFTGLGHEVSTKKVQRKPRDWFAKKRNVLTHYHSYSSGRKQRITGDDICTRFPNLQPRQLRGAFSYEGCHWKAEVTLDSTEIRLL